MLTSVAAHLYTQNLTVALDFFTTKLGFAVDFVYGEPAFYAQVGRDHAKLALRVIDVPVFAGDIREREDLLSATITLASAIDVEQLFQTYRAAGAPAHQTLRVEPWGAKTFIVKDPDGNLIMFAGPAS